MNEALLLQEELGVDLAEHTTLVEQGGNVVSESLTSNSMLIPSLITSEQEGAKPLDASTAIIVTSTISNTTVGITTSTNTNTSKETGKKSAKDDKEPIQIIRGGRVITLPPIEHQLLGVDDYK